MWTYFQSTGNFVDEDGGTVDIGYSGNGAALNNPEMQDVHDQGPTPRGGYVIGAAEDHPHLGPLAMPLEPLPGNVMFGRSGFFIHGDNALMNHTASAGCIILSRAARQMLAASGDRLLHVVE
jgi:hypothetical protein